jgi:hypothetical protein
MVMRAWSAPTYTPAQFRELVYDAKVRAPIRTPLIQMLSRHLKTKKSCRMFAHFAE